MPRHADVSTAHPSEGQIRDRAIGALLGLAIGDAIGTTLEFSVRDSRPPLTDMIGGGPFRLQPGEWTDDTAMALCLADSLLACGGLDERDLLARALDVSEELLLCGCESDETHRAVAA